jgi:hypothetical protein
LLIVDRRWLWSERPLGWRLLIVDRRWLWSERPLGWRLLIVGGRWLLVDALLRYRHLLIVYRWRVGGCLRRRDLLIVDGHRLLIGTPLRCWRLLVVNGRWLIGARNDRLRRSIAEHGLDETAAAVSGLARISELPTGIERIASRVGVGRDEKAGGASRQRGRPERTSKDTPHH